MAKSAHAPLLPNSIVADEEVPVPPRLHLDFLDGLRALLALIVVYDHAFLTIWHPEEFGALQAPFYQLRYLHALGSLSVGGFLVVSGFCLMLPIVRSNGVLKGGAVHFYKRRIRRIVPPYYFAILLALPLWHIRPLAVKLTAEDIFSHLALVHNLFKTTIFTINIVFWSIAVESQIYLLFPLIIASWNRVGKLLTLAGLAGVGVVGLHLTHNRYLTGLCLHLYTMFALGMAGAWIAFDPSHEMQWLRERVSWQLVCLSALGTLFLLFQALGLEKTLTQLVYGYWLVGIAVAAILVIGSQAQLPRGLRWLACKPLVWTGTFSYSLYLIHLPLIETFYAYAGKVFTGSRTAFFLLLAFVAIPLVIAFSYIFFWFCERPFLPGSRQTARQQAAASAASPAP